MGMRALKISMTRWNLVNSWGYAGNEVFPDLRFQPAAFCLDMQCWCRDGEGLKPRRGDFIWGTEEEKIDEWTRCVPSFTHKNHPRGTCQEALQLVAFSWKTLQGGPGASVLLMKLCVLLGALLAPSPCPPPFPSSLLPTEAPGLARVRRRARLSSAALRTQWGEEGRALPAGGAGSSAWQSRCRSHRCRSAEGCRAVEASAPSDHTTPDPVGPRPGRADLVAEFPGYLFREHCVAGNQSGRRNAEASHSSPGSELLYPKLPRGPAPQKERRETLMGLQEEKGSKWFRAIQSPATLFLVLKSGLL